MRDLVSSEEQVRLFSVMMIYGIWNMEYGITCSMMLGLRKRPFTNYATLSRGGRILHNPYKQW